MEDRQQFSMNSRSISANEFSSLKSNRSNRNRILSSNFESENRINPQNYSKASISPLLSSSQIKNEDSPWLKICSNSVKSIE